MTRPLWVWLVVRGSLRRLALWSMVCFAAGLVGALAGAWVLLLAIVGYSVWLSVRALPAVEPSAAVVEPDARFSAHLDAVRSSLSGLPAGERHPAQRVVPAVVDIGAPAGESSYSDRSFS